MQDKCSTTEPHPGPVILSLPLANCLQSFLVDLCFFFLLLFQKSKLTYIFCFKTANCSIVQGLPATGYFPRHTHCSPNSLLILLSFLLENVSWFFALSMKETPQQSLFLCRVCMSACVCARVHICVCVPTNPEFMEGRHTVSSFQTLPSRPTASK